MKGLIKLCLKMSVPLAYKRRDLLRMYEKGGEMELKLSWGFIVPAIYTCRLCWQGIYHGTKLTDLLWDRPNSRFKAESYSPGTAPACTSSLASDNPPIYIRFYTSSSSPTRPQYCPLFYSIVAHAIKRFLAQAFPVCSDHLHWQPSSSSG